jgi:hypothetical protein
MWSAATKSPLSLFALLGSRPGRGRIRWPQPKRRLCRRTPHALHGRPTRPLRLSPFPALGLFRSLPRGRPVQGRTVLRGRRTVAPRAPRGRSARRQAVGTAPLGPFGSFPPGGQLGLFLHSSGRSKTVSTPYLPNPYRHFRIGFDRAHFTPARALSPGESCRVYGGAARAAAGSPAARTDPGNRSRPIRRVRPGTPARSSLL